MALSRIPGVGPVMGKSLIAYCGSAEAVFSEKKFRLARIPGVGLISASAIISYREFNRVEEELRFIEDNHIRAIHFSSPEYPLRLKQEQDSPLVIFVKGNFNLNHERIVGMVGTRKNTLIAGDITRKMVERLKNYNVAISSGLAYGIDITAHKASVEFNVPTIAVVAHGLDSIYPGQHKNVARQMVEQGGAIISEHFSGTALNPDLFPRRNRIVAAISDCIVVVESQKKGGSMITADIAAGYNRDVFAVPGRPTDPMSEGCNYLIKSLQASLCETADDIAKAMNWEEFEQSKSRQPVQNQLLLELNEEEAQINNLLLKGDRTFDDILTDCNIPLHKLCFVLLDLEMKGIIKSLPGKKYSRLR